MLGWLKKLKGKRGRHQSAKVADEATIITRAEHGISRKRIDEPALKVLYRLQKGGFRGCLVGGAVRDLLLDRHPKDFDVATDATPEQVKSLFRNCRLIGRRFRLAHVIFGRTIIEVATFRGEHDGETSSGHLDDAGRILRDNVFGQIHDDVWRRDFTVNALYYDISDFSVIDYVGGMEDIRARRLRLIGDADIRYREDPVRMLRAIRFAAKLDFEIDESCSEPIFELGHLLADIPAARLYEEALKLFHSGHAERSFDLLLEYDVLKYLFPDAARGFQHNPDAEQFFRLAMRSTDSRIERGLAVTPAFLFAAMLWEPLQHRTARAVRDGMPQAAALQKSAAQLITDQVQSISIPRRFSTVMRDIWTLQSRFHYRNGRRAMSVLQHPKFRAGYDFLCLRAQAGEDVVQDCDWWTKLQEQPNEEQQQALMQQSQNQGGKQGQGRRRRRPRRKKKPAQH